MAQFKVCVSCGKQVRQADARCWNCKSTTFQSELATGKKGRLEDMNKTGSRTPPKPRVVAVGALVILACAVGFLYFIYVSLSPAWRSESHAATPSPTEAARPATVSTALRFERSGRYGKYRYTYEEGKDRQVGAFFFDPPLAADDELVVGAMRALLSDAYHVNLRNVSEPKLVNRFMRFITAEGVFDCLVAKDPQMHVLAISIIPRK
jgi:hypothetical protein